MRKKKTVVERNVMIFVLSDIEFVNLNEAQLEILTLNLIFTLVLNQICFSIIKLEINQSSNCVKRSISHPPKCLHITASRYRFLVLGCF